MPDRRRTDVAEGRVVNFAPREKGFMPPFDAVTSVSVVPFTDNGRLVAVLLNRGIDLPGGHVQEGERTVEEVARREAYEEARITLRNVHVATVIQSDYYGGAPEDLTYMVQVAAFVDHMHTFTPTVESSGRVVVDVDEFLDGYTAGDRSLMRHIIDAARGLVHIMIRGLIFDFGGLMLDTEGPDYHSWRETFQAHGCDLPLATWAAYIGGSGQDFDPYAMLEKASGRPIDRAMVRAARRRRFAGLITAEQVLPGVQDYIDTARRLDLKLAVASSSSRTWVAGHLARLGLHAHFDAIVSSDDVARVKPAPDLYLAALAALDLQPHEAIALEDSPNGVTAAKAACLYCVAIPNPLTCQLPLDHADLRLASLADLPLEQLIERINA